MKRLTRQQYYLDYPEIADEHIPEYDVAEIFYLSDNEECPCICVEYQDGSVWVYGAKYDCQIDPKDIGFYLRLE